jgi:prepilin-type N-terminal cleavage/methylation domain-containing protein
MLLTLFEIYVTIVGIKVFVCNKKYIRRERNIVMKKNGFTLAEVLITLAIIGVVATMTLPALMTNTQEQQARTGLKKAVNTLTEAAAMSQAVTGIDFASINGFGVVGDDATADNNVNSLFALLDERTAVDYGKTKGEHFNNGGTMQQSITTAAAAVANPQTVYLRDGSAIIIPADGFAAGAIRAQRGDNLPMGFVVVYDTNGVKAPNILSNCQGATDNNTVDDPTEPAETEDGLEEINTDACTKANRVIRDQFMLRLRGTHVQPEGAAAAWAFNN